MRTYDEGGYMEQDVVWKKYTHNIEGTHFDKSKNELDEHHKYFIFNLELDRSTEVDS